MYIEKDSRTRRIKKITLKKGCMYKLKQYAFETTYIIVCPSKDTILNYDRYDSYHSIPAMFKVDGYGKRRRLHPYSYYKRNQRNNLVKSGWCFNITIVQRTFNTVKPLSPFECSKVGALLREKGFVFNRKTNVLLKLT